MTKRQFWSASISYKKENFVLPFTEVLFICHALVHSLVPNSYNLVPHNNNYSEMVFLVRLLQILKLFVYDEFSNGCYQIWDGAAKPLLYMGLHDACALPM